MFDLFGKLNELKERTAEVKERLAQQSVIGEAGNGKIRVEMSGLRTVNDITVDENWLQQVDHDELQDLLVIAVNRALEHAKNMEETEMRSVAGGLLPPGMSL